jgi:hypothetical protein
LLLLLLIIFYSGTYVDLSVTYPYFFLINRASDGKGSKITVKVELEMTGVFFTGYLIRYLIEGDLVVVAVYRNRSSYRLPALGKAIGYRFPGCRNIKITMIQIVPKPCGKTLLIADFEVECPERTGGNAKRYSIEPVDPQSFFSTTTVVAATAATAGGQQNHAAQKNENHFKPCFNHPFSPSWESACFWRRQLGIEHNARLNRQPRYLAERRKNYHHYGKE